MGKFTGISINDMEFEFKINRLRLQSGMMNTSLAQLSKDDFAIQSDCFEKYVNGMTEISKIIELYKDLIQKDIKDMNECRQTYKRVDEKIASSINTISTPQIFKTQIGKKD